MKNNIRPWRVNYTVTYLDKDVVRSYREPILAILKNVAWLRGIECRIAVDYPFFDEEFLTEYPDLKEYSTDLVYFRSARHTTISLKEYRKLIDGIFEQERIIGLTSVVEVGAQLLKALPQYPFPKD